MFSSSVPSSPPIQFNSIRISGKVHGSVSPLTLSNSNGEQAVKNNNAQVSSRVFKKSLTLFYLFITHRFRPPTRSTNWKLRRLLPKLQSVIVYHLKSTELVEKITIAHHNLNMSPPKNRIPRTIFCHDFPYLLRSSITVVTRRMEVEQEQVWTAERIWSKSMR